MQVPVPKYSTWVERKGIGSASRDPPPGLNAWEPSRAAGTSTLAGWLGPVGPHRSTVSSNGGLEGLEGLREPQADLILCIEAASRLSRECIEGCQSGPTRRLVGALLFGVDTLPRVLSSGIWCPVLSKPMPSPHGVQSHNMHRKSPDQDGCEKEQTLDLEMPTSQLDVLSFIVYLRRSKGYENTITHTSIAVGFLCEFPLRAS